MAAPGKCFLVTGPPGVGKTTLIIRVLESLKQSNPSLKVQGFYTREVREGTERVGFEVVTLDGRKGIQYCVYSFPVNGNFYLMPVRSVEEVEVSLHNSSALKNRHFAPNKSWSPESHRWPTVGRYKVDIASFESLALPELQIKEDTDLFIIDEVGKMELFSSSFFPAVLRILESNIPLLATVPIPKSGRDIPAVARLKNHIGATLYTLNTSNRDAMKEQIYSQLIDLLRNR